MSKILLQDRLRYIAKDGMEAIRSIDNINFENNWINPFDKLDEIIYQAMQKEKKIEELREKLIEIKHELEECTKMMQVAADEIDSTGFQVIIRNKESD
jgi:chromosome condensin MukBEF ATPase and DNA-binding subunit MukB